MGAYRAVFVRVSDIYCNCKRVIIILIDGLLWARGFYFKITNEHSTLFTSHGFRFKNLTAK